MKDSLYKIDKDGNGNSLIPIKPRDNLFQENWLQSLLIKHPNILPVGKIEPAFHSLIPVGREVPTETGIIDNLYISKLGYPVIVETKLWRNPEARRDVFAQSIDYAVSLSKWEYAKLNLCTKSYTSGFGPSFELIDWIEEYLHEPLDKDIIDFEENVSRNLRLGNFLILLVGDRIRSSVVDLMSHFNDVPHLAFNIALVELHCYKVDEDKPWPLYVVPTIKAHTRIVERTIVQVNFPKNIEAEISSEHKKMEKDAAGRSPLTEDEYWSRLKDQSPDSYDTVKKIIEYYRDNPPAFLTVRDNSIAVRVYEPESGNKLSMFFISTDGVIECWPKTINEQFERYELDKKVMNTFIDNMRTTLTIRKGKNSILQRTKDINADKFISIIDSFIEDLLRMQVEIEM